MFELYFVGVLAISVALGFGLTTIMTGGTAFLVVTCFLALLVAELLWELHQRDRTP